MYRDILKYYPLEGMTQNHSQYGIGTNSKYGGIGLYVNPGKPEVREVSTQEQDWSITLRIVN
jgi:hypothetical protein